MPDEALERLSTILNGLSEEQRKHVATVFASTYAAGFTNTAVTSFRDGTDWHPGYEKHDEIRTFFQKYGIDIDAMIRES